MHDLSKEQIAKTIKFECDNRLAEMENNIRKISEENRKLRSEMRDLQMSYETDRQDVWTWLSHTYKGIMNKPIRRGNDGKQ